jgi:pimeloyl-ACP methyl ester carboxylesterase
MTTELSYEGTLKELQTDLGVLRYHEAGDGPPLLLLHGSGPGVTGWRNYRGVLADFAEHFHCYVLEFPGFGVSDPGPDHPMMMAQASVGMFLDGLGLGPVHMIGNSMGGIVATKVAIDEPHRVSKLVTIGGMGKNTFSPGPGEGIKLLMEFTDNPTREALVRWLHSMVFDRAVVTEQLIEDQKGAQGVLPLTGKRFCTSAGYLPPFHQQIFILPRHSPGSETRKPEKSWVRFWTTSHSSPTRSAPTESRATS